MKNDLWNKRISPPEEGWKRLSEKLDLVDHQQDHEERMWRAVASVMIVTALLLASQNLWKEKETFNIQSLSTEAVTLNEGRALQISGTPEGVRFFWILR